MKTRTPLGWTIILPILALCLVGNASASSGKDIFNANKCGACHNVTATPAQSYKEQQEKTGPDLWYAGSKYQAKWLESYLTNPALVRPLAFNSIEKENDLKHPSLSAADAKAVADYLLSLKSETVAQGVIKKADKGIRGRILFDKKQACYGCHRVPERGGKVTGGFSGPSLTNAGNRLQGDWIYSFLKDPKPFSPAGRMPHYSHLNERELKMLSKYVLSFKLKK